jgi:hypothetical protein
MPPTIAEDEYADQSHDERMRIYCRYNAEWYTNTVSY